MGNTPRSLSELAVYLDADLQCATSTELSFINQESYTQHLATSATGAVILNADFAEQYQGNKLVVNNTYLAYAKVSALFESLSTLAVGIHPSAVVSESAEIDPSAAIGANCVIGECVRIGSGVRVYSGVSVGDRTSIGENTLIHANAVLYHGVTVGSGCIIHSGTVIGSDGFGFAPVNGEWFKIAQLGGVVIEDGVEIGANTTIDRGALDNTVIEKGVILDNQIQVAHNVRIGQNTAIAACSAIAGSTVIGKNCIIGGASGIAGHLTIVDGVHITAMTMVIKSLTEPGVYSSGTGVQTNAKWRKSIARLRQLDKMAGRLKRLEQALKDKSPD